MRAALRAGQTPKNTPTATLTPKARAIGADERLDPELVDACAAWFASMEDLYRSIGAIGPRTETAPGADAQTTLLAAFGRSA